MKRLEEERRRTLANTQKIAEEILRVYPKAQRDAKIQSLVTATSEHFIGRHIGELVRNGIVEQEAGFYSLKQKGEMKN